MKKICTFQLTLDLKFTSNFNFFSGLRVCHLFSPTRKMAKCVIGGGGQIDRCFSDLLFKWPLNITSSVTKSLKTFNNFYFHI